MSDVNIDYGGAYGYSSFSLGKMFYNEGMEHKAEGHNDDARTNFTQAVDTFRKCSGQHPEAARYLNLAEQELRNLG